MKSKLDVYCQKCNGVVSDYGLFWAKAVEHKGLEVKDLDLSSVYFVCEHCKSNYPPRGTTRYPWFYGPVNSTVRSQFAKYKQQGGQR